MNTPIKVLALNDDDHDTCFVTYGSYYSNAAEFMSECLLKPHTTTYKVVYVPIFDFGYDKELPEWATNEVIEEMFDSLACCYDPAKLFMQNERAWRYREKAFAFFWEYGNKECFHV